MGNPNYCDEHNTAFFKTGKMRGYAHPIKEGEETVGWCNRPDEVNKTGGKETPPVSVGDGKNRAFALSYSKDLAVAGVIKVNEIGEYAKRFSKYLDIGD
ncbi:hypothetical protein LCGC14_0431330 [marine sediment metagenome]|uniref:Uncharacterized protein n=1 Tax=marine sediment metagenome TaxID=412755 RepID=A0A0F9VXL0_9ZZZZ